MQLPVSHIKSLFHRLSSAFETAFDKLNSVINSTKGHRISYNTTNISGGAVVVFDIDADATHPVLVRFDALIETAFNAGTTNVLTLGGNTATSNDVFAAADIDEATVGATATKLKVYTARQKIYAKYTQTGGAATAGSALFTATVIWIGNK